MILNEISRSLHAAWRVARFESKAINDFDTSFEGFFRSFMGIVLCAPLYGIILVGERDVALSMRNMPELAFLPIAPSNFSVFLTEGIAYVANWVAFPLAMIPIASLIGAGTRYVPFIVAYNWGACIVMAATLIPYLLYFSGLIPAIGVVLFYYPVTLFALVYRWRIARDGLATSTVNATAIVIFDVLLSVFVAMSAAFIRRSLIG